MAEQDFVQISSGTGTNIDADDLAGPVGGGPYRQRVTVADLAMSMKAMLQLLSNLGLAVDPLTGRLRVVIDSTGGNPQTLGALVQGYGIGTTVITDSRYYPLEAMYTTWGQCFRCTGAIV